MNEKYLPIGTVCMLRNGKKRVMITGFCAIPKENKQKMYDYSGCVFPEGLIVSSQVCLFNHDQIDKIYHMGYIDDSFNAFNRALLKFTKEKNSKNIFENKIIEL